ncbi:MFS transporter [Paenibacillus sp. KR2-11]|uniref:MFS transporter n=1 Tax=Paenibacillus sp. KR2-11 TaxID=3385500 RepID=UPI0038FD376C
MAFRTSYGLWFREQPYAWLLLLFLWVFGFAGSLSRFVMAYYQAEITADLGVGRSFLGFTWSTATLLGALCAPLGGWLVDRIGYKKVLLIVAAANLLSVGTVLLFRSPAGFYAGIGILGGIGGLGASVTYVLVTNWFKHHRAKALTILGSAGSLGLAVLTPLLTRMQSLDWSTVYLILLLNAALFLPLILFLVKPSPEGIEEEGQAGRQASSSPAASSALSWRASLAHLRHPVVGVVMFALLTCGFSMGTVEMHMVAIHQTAHVPEAMIASALSLLGLLELVGGLTFSLLIDRMSRTRALAVLYLLRTGAFVLLWIHLPLSPLAFSLLFGATYLGAVPGGILVAGEALHGSGKASGLQTGLFLSIHQLGGVLAALGGGLNYDTLQDYQLLIALNAGFSLAAAAGYAACRKSMSARQRSQATPSPQKEGAV